MVCWQTEPVKFTSECRNWPKRFFLLLWKSRVRQFCQGNMTCGKRSACQKNGQKPIKRSGRQTDWKRRHLAGLRRLAKRNRPARTSAKPHWVVGFLRRITLSRPFLQLGNPFQELPHDRTLWQALLRQHGFRFLRGQPGELRGDVFFLA